ncbi:MAG TPA: ParB/RepB/Spo0J family partition protein [Thermomicrobiales bacterium]|jgi:ParB family chromosome partitioning protein|nr:stage 0 sporulation protein J [Chloroflexota bacterium]HBY47582.1 stage 0 sporulation protein J [Chloroflexota bacterium]HQZ89806.1 ParB/RepB/Spo0J family partition protein [Thermomicrobiales bacterium]HRA30468.1 ParB/RepB/Spo0J family partition protein [Thermomicrobiales bacterium]
MSEQRGRRKRFSVDALFTDTSARGVGVSELVEAKLIQLDRIEPDPRQPRTDFDADALEELAGSIRADGVLQPIAVRYDAERDIYVIIHGERRWRAARNAGLDTIPAVVRDVPEDRRLIHQLVENVLREDLNALDRAAALRGLKASMNDAPWEQVAEAVGIRRSRLYQLLGTEKLAEPLQEALRRGIISEKQTRSIQRLPEGVQTELGNQILGGQLAPAALATYGTTRTARAGHASADYAPLLRQATSMRRTIDALTGPATNATARERARIRASLVDLRETIDLLLRRLED